MTWQTVPLGEIATYIRGVTYRPTDVVTGDDNGVACLRTKNIQAALDLNDLVFVRTGTRHRPEQRVRPNDVLVSSANSWHLVGRAVQANADATGMLIGGFIGGLRFDPEKVDPRFGFRWFSSPEIQSRIRSFGQQTTNIANLNIDRTLRLPIPLPPLPEQRRIAAILDEADVLRIIARSGGSLLEEIEDSVYTEHFQSRPGTKVPLLDLVTPLSGGTPAKSRGGYWNGDIPWVSPKDMKRRNLFGSIDHVSDAATKETNLRLLPRDVVAIVVRGMILAHSFPVVRLRVPSTINQDVKALLPRRPVDPAFLAAALRAQREAILATVSVAGHGTRRLDADALGAISVPDVGYPAQQEFGSIVADLEHQSDTQQSRTAGLESLFASLQHRAFRGEL